MGYWRHIIILYVNKNDIMAFVWVLDCCFCCKMVKMQIRGFHLIVTIYVFPNQYTVPANLEKVPPTGNIMLPGLAKYKGGGGGGHCELI